MKTIIDFFRQPCRSKAARQRLFPAAFAYPAATSLMTGRVPVALA